MRKTQTAKYISAKTNLPLVTIRIDGLVSSYLGSTSKNIKSLFDFVERTPCLLFLDEFDAIAKMRDDSNELGELKRVVNPLLQNLADKRRLDGYVCEKRALIKMDALFWSAVADPTFSCVLVWLVWLPASHRWVGSRDDTGHPSGVVRLGVMLPSLLVFRRT